MELDLIDEFASQGRRRIWFSAMAYDLGYINLDSYPCSRHTLLPMSPGPTRSERAAVRFFTRANPSSSF